MSATDPRDGGWQSRKLHLTIFTQTLIFTGAILAGHFALMGPFYDVMVGGLLAAMGAFLGVNVVAKGVIGRNLVALGAQKPKLEEIQSAEAGAEAEPEAEPPNS